MCDDTSTNAQAPFADALRKLSTECYSKSSALRHKATYMLLLAMYNCSFSHVLQLQYTANRPSLCVTCTYTHLPLLICCFYYAVTLRSTKVHTYGPMQQAPRNEPNIPPETSMNSPFQQQQQGHGSLSSLLATAAAAAAAAIIAVAYHCAVCSSKPTSPSAGRALLDEKSTSSVLLSPLAFTWIHTSLCLSNSWKGLS